MTLAARIPIEPDPPKEEPFQFTALDCSGSAGGPVTSFYGDQPGNCETIKIFKEPENKPAQVLSVARFHPIEVMHCSVHVTVDTATCGLHQQTNSRNYYLNNKRIFQQEFSPHPRECLLSNTTNSLVWVIPELGSYSGQKMTTPLTSGSASGTFYPHGQIPGTHACTGFTWTDPRQRVQLNAALEIKFAITVRSVWVTFDTNTKKIVVPDLVSFDMADANKFVRNDPPPPKPALRHKEVIKNDPERVAQLSVVAHSVSGKQKNLIFGDARTNDQRVDTVAQDAYRSDMVDDFLDQWHTNFTDGGVPYIARQWVKRSATSEITFFADTELGVFVFLTSLIPVNQCDSTRVITSTETGDLFISNREDFDNMYRFQDPTSGVGLAAFLKEQIMLCGAWVWSLHRPDVFILIANSTRDFLKIPEAQDHFLDKSILIGTKIISLTATSTLNIVNLHHTLDKRACEIHRATIKNSLSLVTHDLQQIEDENGRPYMSIVQGEVIYLIRCLAVPAIVRPTPNICCSQLPIYTQDKSSGQFVVEKYLSPFTRRITTFCSPRPCTEELPFFHNVSSNTELAYYKTTNGIPTLVHTAPPPLNPKGIDSDILLPNSAPTVYNERQQRDIDERLNQGEAREAVTETFAYGIVATLNNWLAPVIPAVKQKIPSAFMNALESFSSVGPLPGILGQLPFYVQTTLGIISLVIFAYGMSHVLFLIYTFTKKATVSLRDACHTTVTPTYGIGRAIEFTNKQDIINTTNLESIQTVTNTTKQLQVQNDYFQECIREQVSTLQSDVQFLKENCTCKIRSGQCQ